MILGLYLTLSMRRIPASTISITEAELDAGSDLDNQSILEQMLRTAEERYGPEEAERLKPFLEKLSEAVLKVQGFELEPGDDPSGDPREDR